MASPKSVSFHTLGCKLNYTESSLLAQQCVAKGLRVTQEIAADITVINTCSVTEFADRKCRKLVQKVLGDNPDSRVIVIGCYAQLKPKEIAAIPGVSLVLGAKEKFRLIDHIESLSEIPMHTIVDSPIAEVGDFQLASSMGDRTRSFLKIQDGCDYNCSFCTIPLARGNSRSATIDEVVVKAEQLVDSGVQEIVLTGVNIGDFGHNGLETKERFLDLIMALDEIQGAKRFRISSIEPNLCTDDIIRFVDRSKTFMPHFHMPLQSGSDRTLRFMQRRYKAELYRDRVSLIKEIMPHACIGVDVITGFPTETTADFQESYAFIRDLDISYLHVFTYSARANTKAKTFDQIDLGERRQRNKQLRALGEKKKAIFYAQFSGQKREVLVESSKKPGYLSGYTDNYISVEFPFAEGLLNRIIPMRLGSNYNGEKLSARPRIESLQKNYT